LSVLGRTEADDLAAVVDRRRQALPPAECGQSRHLPVLPEIRTMALLTSVVVAGPVDASDDLRALVDPERVTVVLGGTEIGDRPGLPQEGVGPAGVRILAPADHLAGLGDRAPVEFGVPGRVEVGHLTALREEPVPALRRHRRRADAEDLAPIV